jgi:hypothetical protein
MKGHTGQCCSVRCPQRTSFERIRQEGKSAGDSGRYSMNGISAEDSERYSTLTLIGGRYGI